METPHGSEPAVGAPTSQFWEVDSARSSLMFHLRHIITSRISGRFERWGGRVFVDAHQPWLSSAEIWVDLASISTDEAERDAHVRSPEFLDVDRQPRAEFKSTGVAVRGSEVILDGRLTLHGVSHDVEVRAEVGPVTLDPDRRARAYYTARAVVDRQSFGLHWNQDLDVGGVVVGDEVEIEAQVELVHRPAR
jgi:polyisoprenoid-binding protein YceI